MFRLQTLILSVILPMAFLQYQVMAMDWYSGNHTIPSSEWPGGSEVLNTYNNVTVSMFNSGWVQELNMFGSSALTMYDGYIGELNLNPTDTAVIPHATATLYGGGIFQLSVDPASAGCVKLYAVELFHDRVNNTVDYKWLGDDATHILHLQGSETYSHLQFIPEPVTLVMLALGGLFLRKQKA